MRIKVTIIAEYDYDPETESAEAHYSTSRLIDADPIHRGDDMWFSKVISDGQQAIDRQTESQGAILEGEWKDGLL